MQKPIRYFSSNQAIFGTPDLEKRISDESLHNVGLAQAIIDGQPADGGLYMPTRIPKISAQVINQMKNMSYGQIFVETMKGFFSGVLSKKTLDKIAKEACFFEPLIEEISKKDYIARMDEGPTAAFKDYAAQVLFRVVQALMKGEPKTEIEYRQKLKEIDLLTYLVATSGDTGGAMGTAIHKIPKMWMTIFHSAYISEHISDMQAKQMDNLGYNISVIRTLTDFDGNASLVNKLQNDPDLKYMHPSPANSTNWGRLIPQITYYCHIYSRVATKKGEQIYVSVPSGNFGNMTAGIIAMKMGVPIKLIIGVNENDVFERFHRTGIYAPAEASHPSPSNAMVVNWPSNVRRVFQIYRGQLIEGKDPSNTNKKVISSLKLPDLKSLREDMAVYRISDEETDEIIKEFWGENHRICDLHSTLEAHGAVGWGASKRFRKDTGYNGKIVTMETAHPSKFADHLLKLGIKPTMPRSLMSLANQPHGKYYELPNDYEKVKEKLIELYDLELAKYKQ